jgi:glyoxylase-like metal-dependent hydrolase (beta-lactamase superfamily II)
VRTQTLGDIRIDKVVELERLALDPNWLIANAVAAEIAAEQPHLGPELIEAGTGRLIIGVHSFLVRTPSLTILVDTCCGDRRHRGDASPFHMLQTHYLANLAALGVLPQEIDLVFCTHLHVDHVGWNTRLVEGQWVPTFPNARHVFGRDEYNYWKDHSERPDHIAVFNDSIKPVVDAGLVDLIASDGDVANEITLIPTPGHSPGHMSVHIKSGGEEALLTGDAAHHPVQMAHPDWASTADSDPAQSTRSRRELFTRFADTPTLVIGGHYGAGHLKRNGDAWRFDALQT